MNNFNPFFNVSNMTRSISPFATAGSSFIQGTSQIARSGGLLSKLGNSKFTLSGILNGAQKTIGTVNQIVPLYNQVKPMFQNSKILLNVAKGLKGDRNTGGLFSSKKRRNYNEMFNQSPIYTKEGKINTQKKEERNKGSEPSKPFFI